MCSWNVAVVCSKIPNLLSRTVGCDVYHDVRLTFLEQKGSETQANYSEELQIEGGCKIKDYNEVAFAQRGPNNSTHLTSHIIRDFGSMRGQLIRSQSFSRHTYIPRQSVDKSLHFCLSLPLEEFYFTHQS